MCCFPAARFVLLLASGVWPAARRHAQRCVSVYTPPQSTLLLLVRRYKGTVLWVWQAPAGQLRGHLLTSHIPPIWLLLPNPHCVLANGGLWWLSLLHPFASAGGVIVSRHFTCRHVCFCMLACSAALALARAACALVDSLQAVTVLPYLVLFSSVLDLFTQMCFFGNCGLSAVHGSFLTPRC